ncbi:hypothetical protein BDZ94DRAFT_1299144 [Collybia nuda]|uniref:BTB domain-containing protein n=1 Tax=Collybia nuda TaxID=64659 RepID=A0A9P5Y5J4_9AGAR|nr:hypothetical protein BDZ94DRAFT_1299144 [Collybia nuda]
MSNFACLFPDKSVSDDENINTKVSEHFNAADADVTFQSSDRVLFRVHRMNLEFASGGFPPAETDTHGETVVLSEDASTLELLFQYMYPNPLPDIQSKCSFDNILKLGEAAEKYQVFSAMYICKLSMKYELKGKSHPIEILTYGVKHGYADLADMAALQLLEKSSYEVLSKLPTHLIVPWFNSPFREQSRYYNIWECLLYEARTYNFNPSYSADDAPWGKPGQKSKTCGKDSCSCNVGLTRLAVLENLTIVSALRDLDHVFKDVGCWHFRNDVAKWRNRISFEIYQKKADFFHEFLDPTE